LKDILAAAKAKPHGNDHWQGCCPAHPDHSPSLSITKTDGKILIHCFAGCPVDDVIRSLHVKKSDLFDGSTPARADLEALADYFHLPVADLEAHGLKDTDKGVMVPYTDADGNEATRKYRTKLWGKDKYVYKKGGKAALYGAWHPPADVLVFVEGESDCWVLWHNGVAGRGVPGASSVKAITKDHIRGLKTVYVVQESDTAGRKFVGAVAKKLYDLGFAGRVLKVTMAEGGWKDPADIWVNKLDKDGFRAEWERLIGIADQLDLGDAAHDADDDDVPVLARLITLGKDHMEIYRDERSGMIFGSFEHRGRHVDAPMASGVVQNFLMATWNADVGTGVRPKDVNDAVANLMTMWTHEVRTYHRVARLAEDHIVYDLGDDRCVDITPGGWAVKPIPADVKFIRSQDYAPCPEPKRGGSVDRMRPFIGGSGSDDDFRLVLCWVLDVLKGRTAYITAALNGDPGAGKTYTTRAVKQWTDPTTRAECLDPPQDKLDLSIMCKERLVVDIDNVSKIPADLSDAFCRVATGGAISTRTLYTNADETMIRVGNPVCLNGVPDFVSRGDLRDRSIKLDFGRIPDARRIAESEFWKRFAEAHPYIMGALFDLVANGLKHLSTVEKIGGPRMMESFVWFRACETGTGLNLSDTYRWHTDEIKRQAAEDEPLVQWVAEFMAKQPGHKWRGSASELLAGLRPALVTLDTPQEKAQFPGNGRVLTERVRLNVDDFRAVGINVEFGKTQGKKVIKIDATGYFTPPPTPVEPPHGAADDPVKPPATAPTPGLNGMDDRPKTAKELIEERGRREVPHRIVREGDLFYLRLDPAWVSSLSPEQRHHVVGYTWMGDSGYLLGDTDAEADKHIHGIRLRLGWSE
jgi:hypothetical protein